MHSRSSSSSNAPARKDTDDSILGPIPYPPTKFPPTPGASILEEKPLKAVGVESMTMPGSTDDAVSKQSEFATVRYYFEFILTLLAEWFDFNLPTFYFTLRQKPVNNTQVAVGVLVLSVAAAAVLWRVKE